jgi:hypothetical protein
MTSVSASDIEEMQRLKIFNKYFSRGYKRIDIFIYYNGDDITVLNFIQRFQEITDRKHLGTQVILTMLPTEHNIIIHNFYIEQENHDNWTTMCLPHKNCIQIKINQVPIITPQELYNNLITNQIYSDDFIIKVI